MPAPLHQHVDAVGGQERKGALSTRRSPSAVRSRCVGGLPGLWLDAAEDLGPMARPAPVASITTAERRDPLEWQVGEVHSRRITVSGDRHTFRCCRTRQRGDEELRLAPVALPRGLVVDDHVDFCSGRPGYVSSRYDSVADFDESHGGTLRSIGRGGHAMSHRRTSRAVILTFATVLAACARQRPHRARPRPRRPIDAQERRPLILARAGEVTNLDPHKVPPFTSARVFELLYSTSCVWTRTSRCRGPRRVGADAVVRRQAVTVRSARA